MQLLKNENIFFSIFLLFIILMLSMDMGFFSKNQKEVSLRRALAMTCIWLSFALIFYFLLLFNGHLLHGVSSPEHLKEIIDKYGHVIDTDPGDWHTSLASYRAAIAMEFITGYVVEYALSVDNIFIMIIIFTAFGIEKRYYHRILFWGILGAIIMRLAFIFIGSAAISRFDWILYIFGIFLVYTGFMMLINKNSENSIDPENHKIVKFVSRIFPVALDYKGEKFFIRINTKLHITRLFITLLVIEFTDLIFAVDSIPAIFAVTRDPYLVFFSNIFAILGLRSMFFLLAGSIHRFHYLKYGLAVLLLFIGIKMLAHNYLLSWGLTASRSLVVIIGILAISVLFSFLFPLKKSIKKNISV